ncbi:MAG: hypothetical protein ACYS7M_09310 [Planctomycetota bacterium]
MEDLGFRRSFEANKEYSLDENLWHLSVEGGPLENATTYLDVEKVLETVADRFAGGRCSAEAPSSVRIAFKEGVPVAVNDRPTPLPDLVAQLNRQYRSAPWAWDLVIENRFTGIKSRGLYINPAAKLLHTAADALARSCLNKPMYDRYADLGRDYGAMLYRGEYFSDQRVALEAAARAVRQHLSGTVTVQLTPALHVARIVAGQAIFRQEMATFEKSDYSHQDAQGFIRLNWLSSIGRSFAEADHANAMETGPGAAPDVCGDQPVPPGGLVPSAV